jgi:hypothetical protein
MGRAGIEPATLGLKVRLNKLQRAAPDRNMLQIAQFIVATNCSEMQQAETSLYAHRTHRALPARTSTGNAVKELSMILAARLSAIARPSRATECVLAERVACRGEVALMVAAQVPELRMLVVCLGRAR